ncbi:MAG TPA: acyl-CoA dehydrogenase family protein [Mycobacteriales bacterium]|nr:acyl-CoA dehydrogenase family protein [Mycobacteriales bacterium]
MDLFSADDEAFRAEVRAWLDEHLVGEFAALRGAGGPGREHEGFDVRLAWERLLGEHGWIGVGWPAPYGRELPLMQQVVFHEEYAKAQAPHRVNHIGENLLAPTLIALGTEEQKQRFLPPIARGEELWCQGYSEPDAGSDLANVQTRAVRDGDEWVVTGQKVWTSLAHVADWCFVVARTEPDSKRHVGLSYLLVPMQQDGVEIRPIVQITGTSEFNEVFFDSARTSADNVVGAPGDGWRVAMATLGFERGVATLGQQIGFARELELVEAEARRTGAADDPVVADRLTQAWIDLQVMRHTALRTLSAQAADGSAPGVEASIQKLLWSNWHQRLGELAMAVRGAAATEAPGDAEDLDELQRLFLFSRADTIYGGSNEIQRDIIARRMLSLPRS